VNALPGLGHFSTSDIANPRFREAGDLTLDFSHHDGRVEDRWLDLHPREFAILWRLAERPGEAVSDAVLIGDLWRLRYGYDADDIAGHVARLAAKLATFGLAGLVAAVADGRYTLAFGPFPSVLPGPLPWGQ
jgi:DNA-binding response OmpR family regulator